MNVNLIKFVIQTPLRQGTLLILGEKVAVGSRKNGVLMGEFRKMKVSQRPLILASYPEDKISNYYADDDRFAIPFRSGQPFPAGSL